MSPNVLTDVATTALGVGAVLVMTRPGSQGPGLVKSIMDGITHVVQGSTGQKITK